jgi:hypothetical protein
MLPHLLAALIASSVADGCSAAETRTAAAKASIERLGSIDGESVYLAALEAPCLCGNVNCAYLVFRDDPRAPHILLQTYGWDVRPFGDAEPLPQLREHAHDNALITVETTDTFRDGKYVVTGSARLRGDTGARKPDQVALRFAPGTSSAQLHGSVSLGWYDDYAFSANRGQRLTVDRVTSRARMSLVLMTQDGRRRVELTPGGAITLADSGPFVLRVENERPSDEPPVPYELRLTIR